jgi:hypothetical protein
MTSDLFRFIAFSTLTGDSLAAGSAWPHPVSDMFAAEGGDPNHIEVLTFEGSNGSHVWEKFLPLHVARDRGLTVFRKHVVTTTE